MKKKVIIFCLLTSFYFANAQKELWGIRAGDNALAYGSIFKTDFNGSNPQVVHAFDFATGANPYGQLFVASNGKLYGTASLGGYVLPDTGGFSGGVLYEYDLETDRFRVVTTFGDNLLPNISDPQAGVFELTSGKLYRIYKYP